MSFIHRTSLRLIVKDLKVGFVWIWAVPSFETDSKTENINKLIKYFVLFREFNDFINCSLVRLAVTSNCQLGRDSRIRGLRLFSPILPASHFLEHDKYITSRYIK